MMVQFGLRGNITPASMTHRDERDEKMLRRKSPTAMAVLGREYAFLGTERHVSVASEVKAC